MSGNLAYRAQVLLVLGLLALEVSLSAVSATDVSKVDLETKQSTSVNSTSFHGSVRSPQIRGLEDEESRSLTQDTKQGVLEARQAGCRNICQQRCVPNAGGSSSCRRICNRRCVVGDEEQDSTATDSIAATKPASSASTTSNPDAETDNTDRSSEGPDSGEEETDESDATTPKPKKESKAVPKNPTSGLALSELPDQPTVFPVLASELSVAPVVLPLPMPSAYARPFLDRFHPFSYDPVRFRPYRHRPRFPFRFFDESAAEKNPALGGVLIIADKK